MTEPLSRFDLYILNAETAQIVERRADEIRSLLRRTAKDIIEVGKRLIDVKDLLPHGAFGDWLKAEFDWSERTAQRFMSVAFAFKSVTVSDLDIQPKALYLLAAPSTPEEARHQAIERAEAGETISHARAKAIVTEHKQDPLSDTFSIRSQPTAREPLPPRPSPTPSSFGTWIQRRYNEIQTFQNEDFIPSLAAGLTAAQRQKLSALIEFLQSVEQSDADLQSTERDEVLSHFVQQLQREEF